MAENTDTQDKTEEATPRRREEARDRGQVAISSELITAASLTVAVMALALAGGHTAQAVGSVVRGAIFDLRVDPLEELSVVAAAARIGDAFRESGLSVFRWCLPLLAALFFVGYAQIGVRITPKAIAWDLSKLSPAKNIKKVFSARSVVRTSSALLKITLIATTMVIIAWWQSPRLGGLSGTSTGLLLAGIGRFVFLCSVGALVVILLIALADFAFQRFQHEKDMRMSKKELKDELKNTEGDPHVKGRVRQVQREIARRRMMSEVPKATVVITNPTHYAVALKYERDPDGKATLAPKVVAKGVDHVAQRIKQVAEEAGVTLYEDVPLARALHANTEIGQEIPEQFYKAVASVLAYVYRIRGEKTAA